MGSDLRVLGQRKRLELEELIMAAAPSFALLDVDLEAEVGLGGCGWGRQRTSYDPNHSQN